jgi:hypothetical protein
VLLLEIFLGAFVLSVGVAVVGVLFQTAVENIELDGVVGRSLRWLFLFPLIESLERLVFERLGRISALARGLLALVALIVVPGAIVYLGYFLLKYTLFRWIFGSAVVVGIVGYLISKGNGDGNNNPTGGVSVSH